MNAWLFTAECDLGKSFGAVRRMIFVLFFHSARLLHLSIPSDCLKNTSGPLLLSSFCLLAPTNISLPFLLFVPFLPPSLPLPLSLINTYCKLCLPLQIPKDIAGKRDRDRKINTKRKRSGNSTEQERNWHRIAQRQIKRQIEIMTIKYVASSSQPAKLKHMLTEMLWLK